MDSITLIRIVGNGGAVGILTWFVTILFKAVIRQHEHIVGILCEQRDSYRGQVDAANRRVAEMAEVMKEQAIALREATKVLDLAVDAKKDSQ